MIDELQQISNRAKRNKGFRTNSRHILYQKTADNPATISAINEQLYYETLHKPAEAGQHQKTLSISLSNRRLALVLILSDSALPSKIIRQEVESWIEDEYQKAKALMDEVSAQTKIAVNHTNPEPVEIKNEIVIYYRYDQDSYLLIWGRRMPADDESGELIWKYQQPMNCGSLQIIVIDEELRLTHKYKYLPMSHLSKVQANRYLPQPRVYYHPDLTNADEALIGVQTWHDTFAKYAKKRKQKRAKTS